MPNFQTILEDIREGIETNLARFAAGAQNPDLASDNVVITAEDVFNILAKAKMRQAERLSDIPE